MVKFVWLILLPITLICSTCSLILRSRILKHIMGGFYSTREPEQQKKLKEILERRKLLDKDLQHVGKRLFLQFNSSGVSGATQENFKNCLYNVDQTHQVLMRLGKPYLRNEDIGNTLTSERLERKIVVLENENAKLKTDKLLQKERYENIITTNTKTFHKEKREAEQNYSELTKYCQYLKNARKSLDRTDNVSSHFTQNKSILPAYNSFENMETATKIENQKFEINFKAQNDLICDLKRQLLEYKTELNNIKHSNLVQKQTVDYDFNGILLNQKSVVQIENEKRKTKEHQKLEQQHLKQAVQQDFDNKIKALQRTIFQRDQQLQNLHQQNNISSKSEANLKQELHNLADKYKARGDFIYNLEQRLSYTIIERDALETNISKLQQKIEQTVQNENGTEKAKVKQNLVPQHLKQQVVQQEFENKNEALQTTIYQRDQQVQNLHEQHNILLEQTSDSEANFMQEWHNLQKNYHVQGDFIQNLEQRLSYTANERKAYKTQNVKLQQQIVHMRQIENDNREQQNLEQKHSKQFQSVQQESENKIEMLQTTLYKREQELQNLLQQNKILQEQFVEFEASFKQEWYNLEENYTIGGKSIAYLKQRLSYIANERDIFKTQIDKLQQEMEQMVQINNEIYKTNGQQQQELEAKIVMLQATLHQSNQQLQKLHQENEILHEQNLKLEADFKQKRSTLEENYKTRGVLLDNLEKRLSYTVNERDAFKTQILKFQQEIVQLNFKIAKLNEEILQLRNEGKQFTAERQQTRTYAQQGNQENVENQNKNQPDAENEYVRKSLKAIEIVFEDAIKLEAEVKEFSGTKEDGTFLHLQELLIRSIVKLDNVDSKGILDIRKRRKEVIQYVQKLLTILKEKT